MAREKKIIAELSLRDRFSKTMQRAREHTKNYGKEWERQSKKVSKAAKKIEKASKTLTKNITVPVTAISAASVASFKALNDGYQTIISKTGATGDAAKKLNETYKNTFKNLYFEGEVVGQAIGEVNTQFGLTGDSLQNLSTYALKFAHINRADVTKSIIGASKIQKQFNIDNKDAYLIFDAVTKSAQNTGVETDKIFELVAKGAPSLKAMGLDFAQSAEMMARAEQAGIDASAMIGYLSKASVNYAKNGKSLSDGLSETIGAIRGAKDETTALSIASKAFGSKGAVVMANAIRSGRLDVSSFANTLNEVKGATESTEKEMRSPFDRFNQAINKAKPALAEFAAVVLENAIPYIEKLSSWISKGAKAFESMSPGQKSVASGFLLFASAAGPVLGVISKIIAFIARIWPLIQMLIRFTGIIIKVIRFLLILARVFTPVGLAITALVVAGVILYKNWEKVKAVGSAVWQYLCRTIKNIIGTIKSVLKGFIDFIAGVFTGDWKRALEGIKQIFKAPFDFMKNQIQSVIELWENLTDIFTKKKPQPKTPFKPTVSKPEDVQKASVSPVVTKGRENSFKAYQQAKIAHHAKGTKYFQGGLTYINERGKEIVDLPRGSVIYPHDKSLRKAYETGKDNGQVKHDYHVNFSGAIFYVREEADVDKVADKVVKKIVDHNDNRKVG